MVAFVSLSLVPTILLFLVAVGFITNSVEHWFSAQVEQSLQGSLEVAQTYYRDFANDTVSAAQQISKSLSKQGIFQGIKRNEPLREQLEARRQEYHLSTLRIFLKGGRRYYRSRGPHAQRRFSSVCRRICWKQDFQEKRFPESCRWERER